MTDEQHTGRCRMAEDVKLLPCPFCGGQVFIHHGHRDIGYVTCGQRDDGSDGCGVVASFRPNKGGREAIAAWNRRATAAKDAEIKGLRAEVAEARDGWHMANGTAELAMKHRDAAEARAEQLAEALRYAEAFISVSMPQLARDRDEAVNEVLPAIRAALNPTAAQEGE